MYDYNKRNPDSVILNFFKNIISTSDFDALESSLYLREKFYEDRNKVPTLKQDIIKNFGNRGRNIANLCTAGYFEHFFMKLYNSSPSEFKEIYELSVAKSIIAVFVYYDMKKKQITEDFKNKIQTAKKYGIDFIHIHGIGKNNIQKIKETLKENEEVFKYYQKRIFEDSEEGIIVVEILLMKSETVTKMQQHRHSKQF